MEIRPFEAERDLKAIQRIWWEIGWIDSDVGEAAVADMLATGCCLTAALDGQAECMAHRSLGAMRYQNSARNRSFVPNLAPGVHEDLSMCAVTAVMTSRIARKLGLALRLTARQLAAGAEGGAALAVLGVFDQGFYDRLGFGTGSYEHTFRFDPATLQVDASFRPPKRLTKDDWQAVHGAMMNRRRGHGGCLLPEAGLMKAELGFRPNGFGFGYERDGALTHCVWLVAEEMEHGPYLVQMLAYQDGPQLLELLALLKSLGDQVSLIEMREPPDIQMQTLLREPFRNRRKTRNSDYAAYHRTAAWWQLRMLDVEACVAARHWPGEKVQFNLKLTDPVAEFLSDGPWRGCAGDYWISVGPTSYAESGHRDDLPTLQASVNAFSRLWFGVVPATGLAVTDGLDVETPAQGSDFMASPAPLLDRLDEALCLPPPRTGWDF
ncbi:MAG: hypothetical protein OXP11_01215 [Gammaproteobacteria bacterium]|nr:hypothetical protein [Gammaproteobacteria bacterium]